MNEVLTMDEILERENDWLMKVTAQRITEECRRRRTEERLAEEFAITAHAAAMNQAADNFRMYQRRAHGD